MASTIELLTLARLLRTGKFKHDRTQIEAVMTDVAARLEELAVEISGQQASETQPEARVDDADPERIIEGGPDAE